MRTVQIYVGRQAAELDCVRVTFTIDGVTQTVDVEKVGTTNDRNEYSYNPDLSEGDYIVTEDGDYIVTEDDDYLITESSVFTPSIYIYWDGSSWNIQIIVNGVEYNYCSSTDVYYPFLEDWEVCDEGNELDYLITTECDELFYERLELFNDEKINVTLNVQNLSDISKTFTDFSQSFTVPASNVNNRIFEHFYQNDVDATIDYNLKRPAYIEIDFIPFRRGVITLEKANVKNGVADSYSISFFGALTNLKNIFGETRINQLDLASLGFEYTAANVLDRITDTGTDYDVRFPLIANSRLWTYADGGSEDITVNASAIAYTELFPAVKVARLFDAMQSDFGITFVGQFFIDTRFTELFLEAKNATNFTFKTETQNVSFLSRTNLVIGNNPYSPADYVSIPNSTITISELLDVNLQEITFNVVTKSALETAYLDVFKNGIFDRTYNIAAVGTIPNYILHLDYIGPDIVYSFQVRADAPMDLEIAITYEIRTLLNNLQYTNSSFVTTAQNTLTGDLDVRNYLPDMRVSDFFSGILKQFNMTCVGVEENTFEILPLEDWYNNGATIDVTQHIDFETTDISRVPLYRNIGFQYQQSESFANRQFFAISNSEYGNTNNTFSYDGGDFTIESPFENLLFVRSVGSASQEAILGYFLNSNYQSYIPKPTLLYLYGASDTLTTNIKFYNGGSYDNISSYALFGQDLEQGGINYSLNFGADNSIILNETIQNGLFATYYFAYLSNLYNLKQRLTSVKAMLPLSILTNLQLNDRLVIRDKRYIINDIKTELTTGEATLTLYNDFRDIQLFNYRVIDSGLNVVFFVLPYRDGNQSATITRTPSGLTLSTNSVTWADGDFEPKVVAGTVGINSTGLPRRFTVTMTYVNGAVNINYIIQEA
jgi:hypothetical protein